MVVGSSTGTVEANTVTSNILLLGDAAQFLFPHAATAPVLKTSKPCCAAHPKLYNLEPKMKIATTEILDTIQKLNTLKFDRKVLDANIDELETELKNFVGDDVEVTFQGVPIYTYKTVETNRVDSKLLKSEFPVVYQQVLKPVVSRRLHLV